MPCFDVSAVPSLTVLDASPQSGFLDCLDALVPAGNTSTRWYTTQLHCVIGKWMGPDLSLNKWERLCAEKWKVDTTHRKDSRVTFDETLASDWRVQTGP